MRGAKMCIFDVLHAVRWHNEAQIGKRFSTATCKSSQNQRLHSQSPSCFQSSNDIRRTSTPRNCQRNIAFFGEALQLFGKNLFVRFVVCPGRNQRDVVRQCDGLQTLRASTDRTLPEVTCEV